MAAGPGADRISSTQVMAIQAGFQAGTGFVAVRSAFYRVGPTRTDGVIDDPVSRLAMTIHAKLPGLVTGQTILFLAASFKGMGLHKVQRVDTALQIYPFMTVLAKTLGMALGAAVGIEFRLRPVGAAKIIGMIAGTRRHSGDDDLFMKFLKVHDHLFLLMTGLTVFLPDNLLRSMAIFAGQPLFCDMQMVQILIQIRSPRRLAAIADPGDQEGGAGGGEGNVKRRPGFRC
jgi:hypothetical protein